jgi:hypothetical protein
MSLRLPNPSSRLMRAATAERTDLIRHRERLIGERDRLMAELRRVGDALDAVDDRVAILSQLVEDPEPGDVSGSGDARDVASDREATPIEHRKLLRGPAIREAAVQVLIAQPEHIEALHYRRWYELLEQAGYAVAGKDPVAVFLTQVTRSPVVRKATEPGTYEVDRQAPLRIRQRLERLQGELRELAAAPQTPVDLSSVRARRHELDLAISQHERALEEALRVLRPAQPAVAAAVSIVGAG